MPPLGLGLGGIKSEFNGDTGNNCIWVLLDTGTKMSMIHTIYDTRMRRK